MKKIIVTDLDETIIPVSGDLPKRAYRILKGVKEKGHTLIYATGRPFDMIPEKLLQTDADYAITSNGACVYRLEDHEKICSEVIANEDVRSVISYFQDKQIHLGFTINGVCYEEKKNCDLILFTITEDMNCIFGEDVLAIALESQEVEKMMIWCTSPEVCESYKKELREQMKDLDVSSSNGANIELMKKNVNKGNALKTLCEKLSVDAKDIVVIGDNENDLEMFAFAGEKIAPENARECVKAIADKIVPSCAERGVLNYLETL